MRFTDGIDHLIDAVGEGDLTITDEIDQAYAHYQDAGVSRFSGRPLVYHRGGNAKFLENALEEHFAEYLRDLASAVITENGSRLEEEAAAVGEKLAGYSESQTPYESGALKGSSHVTVTSNGQQVYDRGPTVPRTAR